MEIAIDKWSQKNLLAYIVKSWRKKSNCNTQKQMLRGVPWDKLFYNFKNIARDILSSKIFVKYLNICQLVLCIYNYIIMVYIYKYIYVYIYIYIYIYTYICIYIYILYIYIYIRWYSDLVLQSLVIMSADFQTAKVHSLVVSDLRSEAKGSRIKSGC